MNPLEAWKANERFRLSGRRQDDLEEFGRTANPSGRITVPAPEVDPYVYAAIHYSSTDQDLPSWPMDVWDPYADDPDIAAQYQNTEPSPEALPDTGSRDDTSTPKATNQPTTFSARGQGTIMAGEITITVIGNLTNDPELRFTPVSREFGKTEGTPVANFTIASTPRMFDPQSKEWKDGETLFLRSTVWREAAEHVAASLTKGSRVVASGRLKPRTYETKTGEKRTVIEFEIDEIGLSLRYTAVAATGAPSRRPVQDEAPGPDEIPVQEKAPRIGWRDRLKGQQETGADGYADDDPWFGKNVAGEGYAQPARHDEPTF